MNIKIINKKFNLILNLISVINIIKYKIKTNITIQKFISLFLKNHLYSSSINPTFNREKKINKTPIISKFKNNNKLKIVLNLISLQLPSLY